MTIKIGFGAVGIKGGEDGNLDEIGSSSFRHRDICFVNHNDKLYIYRVDQYSGEEEDYPYIIKPTDIGPDSPLKSRMKRWKLVSQEDFVTHIIQRENDYIQTSDIRVIEDDVLSIESGNGSIIVINEDGIIEFPNITSAAYPESNHNLTNRKYLQDKLDELESLMDSYADNFLTDNQYIIDKLEEVDSIIKDYVEQETTDNDYVISQIDGLDTEIRDYADAEISTSSDSLSADIDNYYTWLEFTVDSWTADGDLYYSDIEHNIGDKEFLVSFFADSEVITPVKVEHTNSDTLRVWMPTDSEAINSNIFYIKDEQSPYLYKLAESPDSGDAVIEKREIVNGLPITDEFIYEDSNADFDYWQRLVYGNDHLFIYGYFPDLSEDNYRALKISASNLQIVEEKSEETTTSRDFANVDPYFKIFHNDLIYAQIYNSDWWAVLGRFNTDLELVDWSDHNEASFYDDNDDKLSDIHITSEEDIIASGPGVVYKFDINDLSLIDSFTGDWSIYVCSTSDNDYIYSATDDGYLYKLNKSSLTEESSLQINNKYDTNMSPTSIVYHNGYIYIGLHESYEVMIVDSVNMTLESQFDSEISQDVTQMFIGPNDNLFINAYKKTVEMSTETFDLVQFVESDDHGWSITADFSWL